MGRWIRLFVIVVAVGAVAVCAAQSLIQNPKSEIQNQLTGNKPAGVVSHIKVLSDKTEDVSSMEAWRKSFIKEGMPDAQKAIKIWETVVKFRHQDSPPNEFLHGETNVHDPIKTFNVYGYGMCCCASSNIEALGRHVGLQARGWGATGHSLPELFYDGKWHMLDASLETYYLLDDKKTIAGIEDLSANPEGLVNKEHCPWVDAKGWYPAKTHNIKDSAKTYKKGKDVPFPYEYGYSQGYQVNIQLRPGERLTRNWSNRKLHANMNDGGTPGCMGGARGEMNFQKKLGDIAPGRLGNGTLEYEPPLASPDFKSSALTFENLASGGKPALHVADAGKPGVLVVRMPSSYVYLTGQLTFKAVVAQGGELVVSFSDNNGLDWKEIGKAGASGDQSIDLKPLVFRRYDYRLRFEMKGQGTGLDSLKIVHDVQHSQAPLPILAQGSNTITFSAEPQEGTITVEGATDPAVAQKGKQLSYKDFHPQMNGLEDKDFRLKGGLGDITWTVATPGDMTRIRFGGFFRARGAKDGWDMQVSFDQGKTWKTIDRMSGPTPGCSKYAAVPDKDVPPGTRSALVRFAGTQQNTTCMFSFRIDADYKEPNGGLRPVRVTYVYDENGAEQKAVHIASKPNETWKIQCKGAPAMKSIILELAQQ
jgi:hypothetical protein